MQTTEEWEDLGALPTLLIAPIVESLFNAESNPRIISHRLRTATTITQFVRCLWGMGTVLALFCNTANLLRIMPILLEKVSLGLSALGALLLADAGLRRR